MRHPTRRTASHHTLRPLLVLTLIAVALAITAIEAINACDDFENPTYHPCVPDAPPPCTECEEGCSDLPDGGSFSDYPGGSGGMPYRGHGNFEEYVIFENMMERQKRLRESAT